MNSEGTHFVRMQVSTCSELSDAAFRKQMREARAGYVLEVTVVTHETLGVWQGPAPLLRWQRLSVYFRLFADTQDFWEEQKEDGD